MAFCRKITFTSPAVNPSEIVEVIVLVVIASIERLFPATSETVGVHIDVSDQFQSVAVNALFSPVMSDRFSAFAAIAEAAVASEYIRVRQ